MTKPKRGPTMPALRATARRAVKQLLARTDSRARTTTDVEEKIYLWLYLEKLQQALRLLDEPRRTSRR